MSNMMKNGCDTHLVLKYDDIMKYIPQSQREVLQSIQAQIIANRLMEGKNPINQYYICNVDEPYANDVKKIILEGEDKKKQS